MLRSANGKKPDETLKQRMIDSAWRRDFMTDPYAMLDCAFVMKDGIIYQTESDIV